MYREVLCCACVCLLLTQTLLVSASPLRSSSSRLSAHFNQLAGSTDGDVASSRHRRHATDLETLEALEEDHVVSIRSRSRRSAVLFLAAAMRLCNGYPERCEAVEVGHGKDKVRIVITDE